MGAFLEKPKTDKLNESGNGNGIRYGLSSMQGWRVEMEDAHCAVTAIPDLPDWSFFAVFDGHAGAKVSAYCAEHLLKTIISNEDWRGSAEGTASTPRLSCVARGIKTGFLTLDDEMRKLPEIISGEDKSGSTAVCLLVSPEHLFFANLGDSRAILCRDGKVAFSTEDHKPSNPPERERIESAGGSVLIQRINGSLAVSRALGDFEYKSVAGKGPCDQLVSPEPETTELERGSDEFVVLACDGIWDVMSNEDLAVFIRNRMMITDDLSEICNQVVDTCLYKGSRDNMSIVIAAFAGAPKVDPEARKRDQELDASLEASVKSIVESTDTAELDLPFLMQMLACEPPENLSPDQDLSAKKHVIERAYHKFLSQKNTSASEN